MSSSSSSSSTRGRCVWNKVSTRWCWCSSIVFVQERDVNTRDSDVSTDVFDVISDVSDISTDECDVTCSVARDSVSSIIIWLSWGGARSECLSITDPVDGSVVDESTDGWSILQATSLFDPLEDVRILLNGDGVVFDEFIEGNFVSARIISSNSLATSVNNWNNGLYLKFNIWPQDLVLAIDDWTLHKLKLLCKCVYVRLHVCNLKKNVMT